MNKDLYFEHIEEFADYIIGRVEDNDELFVAVVGKFETIKPLLKEVMTYEFVDFDCIEIENEIVDDYTDEFVLSLWMNDDVLEVGCEKLKGDDEYMSPCGDETYLFEDCSSKIIPLCEDSDLYFVNFYDESDYEECDGECCSCCRECNDEDDDIRGFVAIKNDDNGYYSVSYYTREDLDEKYIRYLLKKFGF